MDKDYQFMMDCIGRLLTASEQNQETAQALLHRLKRQLDGYEEKQKQLESRISASVNTSLQTAVERSIKNITVSFDQAKDAANNAAQRYETSSRWAIWKVVIIGSIIFGIFAAMTFGFLLYYFPSPTELKKLISDRNALLHQMEDLRESGALTKVIKCNDAGLSRLCVRVEKSNLNRYISDGESAYVVIHGY